MLQTGCTQEVKQAIPFLQKNFFQEYKQRIQAKPCYEQSIYGTLIMKGAVSRLKFEK